VIGKVLLFGALATLALPLIHPFGPVRQQRSEALLPDLPSVAGVCQNCHSERTEWPLYSRLPVVSWMLERDVAEARRHMNLSRWASYPNAEKKDLLARIAAEVRSHQMPPARYTMLHTDARLSEADIAAIYQWTRAQRSKLRVEGINQASPESSSMAQ
jgi:cytochrome c